jgi:hypothetical protein
MRSFQSVEDARCEINEMNPIRQVMKVALLFPVLGRKNTLLLPQGSVGQGGERVCSLIRWGDGPDKGFFRTALAELKLGLKEKMKFCGR